MTTQYNSKVLDHLGIISAVCDEIGLTKTIDEMIPPDLHSKLSVGECVKLMIINGLGFSSRPLYLEAQFFNSKPVERFISRQIGVNEITDDRLGKCLDSCYEKGCDTLFATIATKAAIQYNIDSRFRHLDTTSISVDGEYGKEDDIGLVQFGYSKDGRNDLKQFMISLMTSQDGDVPLLAKTIEGNSSDKTHFRETLTALKQQIDGKESAYFVADSALYNDKTLTTLASDMLWITRVPESLKQCRELVGQVDLMQMQEVGGGYRITEMGAWYGGVRQRWVIVFSEKAKEREKKTLERRLKKLQEEAVKQLNTLRGSEFACEQDANNAAHALSKKLNLMKLSDIKISKRCVKEGKGRPKKDGPKSYRYSVEATIVQDDEAINALMNRKGKFVIASNELDQEKLSAQDLLSVYKEQQSVERGFRFLKDPMFMTSTVFLKTETRIVALAMIMCLCLLVYTLAQRLLRKRLSLLGETLPNQLGKPTKRPTMRWIFQIFEGVHVLLIRKDERFQELVLNLTDLRIKILKILGPSFEKIYEGVV